jgi:hypothetical protein
VNQDHAVQNLPGAKSDEYQLTFDAMLNSVHDGVLERDEKS